MNNPEKTKRRATGEVVCWILAGAGAVVAGAPFLWGESVGMGRYVLVLLGALLTGTALLVIPLYRARQRVTAALASDGELLGRWEVPADEWSAWVAEDAGRERSMKWQLFGTVLAFSVGIGGFFAWMDREAGPIVLAVLLGLCAVIAFAIVVGTRHQQRRRQGGPREVRIGRDGLRLGDELHVWEGFGARLEGVEVVAGHPPCLEIVYSTRAKNQRQINSVRVPIPRGGDAAAAEVVARLRARGTGSGT